MSTGTIPAGQDVSADIAALADTFNTSASIHYYPGEQRWSVAFRGLHVVRFSGVLWNDKAKGTRQWDIAATTLAGWGSTLHEAFSRITDIVDSEKPYLLCNTELGLFSGGFDDDQPYITEYQGRVAGARYQYASRGETGARVRAFLDQHAPRPLPPLNG